MIHQLKPGSILYQCGPVQMSVSAHARGRPLDRGLQQAVSQIPGVLQELVECLDRAKSPWPRLSPSPGWPSILTNMYVAVKATGEPSLTPMAAVAGAFADLAADTLAELGADRVVVNNGGDIALRLEPGQSVKVGLAASHGNGGPADKVLIIGGSGVAGIATSGLLGRSLTLGIADAVTTLAKSAAYADACATVIANHTDLAHPLVERRPAALVDKDTDLQGMWVTTSVGRLQQNETTLAIERGLNRARGLARSGVSLGSVISVQDQTGIWPLNLFQAEFN